mgnify:CR=1 FL=1
MSSGGTFNRDNNLSSTQYSLKITLLLCSCTEKLPQQNNHLIEITEMQKVAGETRHISYIGLLFMNDKLLANQTPSDSAKHFVKFTAPIKIISLKLTRFRPS